MEARASGIPLLPALPLRGERLLLRPWQPDDAEALFSIFSRSDVNRWLYTLPIGRDELPALLDERVAHQVLDADSPLKLAATLAATGELVGDFALRVWSARDRQGEIGFVIHPDHHGRGYATEGAALLLQLGFEAAGFHRILGRLEARNEPSARVLERLGMRREAHFVENELVKGAWESEVVYALLEREWRARQGGGSEPTPAP